MDELYEELELEAQTAMSMAMLGTTVKDAFSNAVGIRNALGDVAKSITEPFAQEASAVKVIEAYELLEKNIQRL